MNKNHYENFANRFMTQFPLHFVDFLKIGAFSMIFV